MLSFFRSRVLVSPCVFPNATLPTVLVRTKTFHLKTKNAAKKRFRVTGKGDVKYYPKKLGGKSIRMYRKETEGSMRHIPKVLPAATSALHGAIKMTNTPKEAEKERKAKELKELKKQKQKAQE